MLVSIDYTKNKQTKYLCDRCKVKMTTEIRRAILVQEHGFSALKKWDLCPSCYRKLCNGIAKGVKKEVAKDE